MIFTFGVESNYNERVEPAYVMDMVREQLLLNKDYRTWRPFGKAHPQTRFEQNYDAVGQVSLELTFSNEGWGQLLGAAIGQAIRLDNKRFRMSSDGLRAVFAKLDLDLAVGQTGFDLDEYYPAEFDGTNILLIGDEVITDAVINAGTVTSCTRGALGTEEQAHYIHDYVYMLDNDASRKIDICCPKYLDNRAILDKSLSIYVKRPEAYFCYTGVKLDQLEMRLSAEDIVYSNLTFAGANGDLVTPLSPIETFDDGLLVASLQAYSLLEDMDLRRIYINFNNTLHKTIHGYNGQRQDMPLQFQNVYGQLTWVFSELEHYLDYVNNNKHTLSVQMIDWTSKPFNNAIIFNSNDLRINTFSPQYTGGLVIQDSAPYYTYGPSQVYIQY